ncbi:unnamed protein product [Litomosoides sigmodontis]|uniref:Serpin domain-containing protein n=1 Tax=Litomosoides sigmodontis TaxID=42156 RepID=A0A3P6SMC5_LITSI|nr:unnamed protein product [Litomosoides sigmodontis]
MLVTSLDHPKISSWECLPLIDFGIALLNTIPSKRLNLAYLPETEVQNLRITNEEWNLAISPLQIIRGLAALHALADGKCKIKLANLISKALSGRAGRFGKSIHDSLNNLCISYLKSLSKGVIEIYFEENQLLTFDNELVEFVEKYYGTEEEGHGGVEYVVRRELSPKQRTRLALVTMFNSTFYWKPPGQLTQVEIFFYETYKKLEAERSVIKAYRCSGLFRTCVTGNGTRVIELDSEIPNLKMYLFQPQMLFSKDFLKSLNAEELQYYIDQLHQTPTQQSVVIPCFSINSPVGLRSVFASCNPFFHFILKSKHPLSPYPCIARIFSPDKAEFGKIYGKTLQENYSPFHIYPLWDYYHKTKIALKTGQPVSEIGIDKEMRMVTFSQRTMKDELTERKDQEIVSVTGKMMIIEGQVGADRKHYIIGILGTKNNENFGSKRMLSSLSKLKMMDEKGRGSSERTSVIGSNSAATTNKWNKIDRSSSSSQSKQSPRAHNINNLLKNTMRRRRIQRSLTDQKKSQSLHSKDVERFRRHSTIGPMLDGNVKKKLIKSSASKSTTVKRQLSGRAETTQCDSRNDEKPSETQLSKSFPHSVSERTKTERFMAGAEMEKQNEETSHGKISSEKATTKLNATILRRKQSIFRLLKKPEISLADKRGTIVVEQDEPPGINSYFVAKESEVKETQADVIFNTPFLYMLVSKSEMERFLVTNIQETNPPENMNDRDVPDPNI